MTTSQGTGTGTDAGIVTASEIAAAAVPRSAWWRYRWLIGGIGIFLCVAAVRDITGESDLTSAGTMNAMLIGAVPIGMAALGGLWSERSGIINIGLEGMMMFGTWFGAAGTFFGHSVWVGLVCGILGGGLGGLLHAIACVSFGVDHIVSGVAITILAQGLTRYLSVAFFADQHGGGATQSPELPDFPSVSVPGISHPLGKLAHTHWYLASDLAGLLRGFLTSVNVLTILAIVLIVVTYYVLWRTPFGLRLRSCGENPSAAESLGVGVYKMKYIAVVISGALAGFGGVFLAMVATSGYQEGQTGGRGYIGLAAMIFGNWRPGGLAAGAGLFGYTDALQLRGSASAVHGLLLLVAAGLVALAVFKAVKRAWTVAAVSLVIGIAVLVVYLITDTLPQQLVTYTPHITTLLVLALASQRLRMPAADGLRWRRGQGS